MKITRILTGAFGYHGNRLVLILIVLPTIVHIAHTAPAGQTTPSTTIHHIPSYEDAQTNDTNLTYNTSIDIHLSSRSNNLNYKQTLDKTLQDGGQENNQTTVHDSSENENQSQNSNCLNCIYAILKNNEKIKSNLREIQRNDMKGKQSAASLTNDTLWKSTNDSINNKRTLDKFRISYEIIRNLHPHSSNENVSSVGNNTQEEHSAHNASSNKGLNVAAIVVPMVTGKAMGSATVASTTSRHRATTLNQSQNVPNGKDSHYINIHKRGNIPNIYQPGTTTSNGNIEEGVSSSSTPAPTWTTTIESVQMGGDGETTVGNAVFDNSTDVDIPDPSGDQLPKVETLPNQQSTLTPDEQNSSFISQTPTASFSVTSSSSLSSSLTPSSIPSSSLSSSSSSSQSLPSSTPSSLASTNPSLSTEEVAYTTARNVTVPAPNPSSSTPGSKTDISTNQTVFNNTTNTVPPTTTTDETGKLTQKPEHESSSSTSPSQLSTLTPFPSTHTENAQTTPTTISSSSQPQSSQQNNITPAPSDTTTTPTTITTIDNSTLLQLSPIASATTTQTHTSTTTSTTSRTTLLWTHLQQASTTTSSSGNEPKPTQHSSATVAVITTPSPAVSERPTSFVELNLGMTWSDFCSMEMSFAGEVVQIFQHGAANNGITTDQIKLMNKGDQCADSVLGSDKITVQLYLLNKTHHYDKNLTRALANLLKSDFETGDSSIMSKLIDVQFRESKTPLTDPNIGLVEENEEEDGFFNDPGIAVAICIGVLGMVCCTCLIVIQYLWRKRHREGSNLSTKQTNRKSTRVVFTSKTNRSFSLASADSIQLYSVSGKSSRRSSGILNLGLNLSDPLDPTHPLNVDQLAEFCSDTSKIRREYEKIPNRLPRLSVVPIGEEDKNRYANVLPLPHTRVKLLQDGVQTNHSSYINASYVTGPNNECQYYIATQAPTERTTGDFWTMVWQQQTTAIVMMTQMEEDGQSKSAAYWPELTGKSAAQRHGDFLVELKQKDVNQEYIVSKLELNNLRKIETRTIHHYLYTCWTSNGTPEPISLVKFVLDCRPKYESGKAPLVVHCSPGTGRTCTFIGLDLCMRQFETHRVVDLLKTVHDMRHERAGAIQNKDQYILLYKAINDYAKIVVSPNVSAASSATTLHALLPG